MSVRFEFENKKSEIACGRDVPKQFDATGATIFSRYFKIKKKKTFVNW
jgi:hypothetical protein